MVHCNNTIFYRRKSLVTDFYVGHFALCSKPIRIKYYRMIEKKKLFDPKYFFDGAQYNYIAIINFN